jgi:hypothetical protein
MIIKKTKDVSEYCEECGEMKPWVIRFGTQDNGCDTCQQCIILGLHAGMETKESTDARPTY